jgi:hypothetical protein
MTTTKITLIDPDEPGMSESVHVDDLGGGRYQLQNIPWLFIEYHLDDVLYDFGDGAYEVIQYSGNHTLGIRFEDGTTPPDIKELTDQLDALGISGEGCFPHSPVVVYNIPAGFDLMPAFELIMNFELVETYIVG